MFRNHRRTSSLVAVLALVALCLGAAPGFAAGPQVNINSASVEQLSLLPRIGPSVAARIVEFRKENGPFKNAEDLMLVRGVGEKTFEGLRAFVAISGDTTLKEKVASPRAEKTEEPKG
jgi:competence protein ComEA